MTQHGTPGLDRTGILAGSAAYLWWGLAAFYWVPAKVVPAVDLLAHRAFWAAPFCAVLLLARGRLRGALRVLRAPRSLLLLGCSSALVALNWGIFLHAMGQNRLAEASLGYFMQPLVTVLIGLVGFRERLTPLQWMSVGFAAAGVAVYTSALGYLPLVALGVSVSFGLYGAVLGIRESEHRVRAALLGVAPGHPALLIDRQAIALDGEDWVKKNANADFATT
jgi:chloramphenicol-sensitive protein RarD